MAGELNGNMSALFWSCIWPPTYAAASFCTCSSGLGGHLRLGLATATFWSSPFCASGSAPLEQLHTAATRARVAVVLRARVGRRDQESFCIEGSFMGRTFTYKHASCRFPPRRNLGGSARHVVRGRARRVVESVS